MTRNAVVVRAGRHSTHAGWMTGGVPDFDLIVAAYEDLPPGLLAGATETCVIPGAKVAGWARLFASRPELMRRYDRIALLDDDIVCAAGDLNAAFEAGRRHDLALWQPSLSWESYFSYAVFLRNPLFRLRYVNFIEMMCPFFAKAHLARCLPLFDLGYETGIDRLWCRLSPDPQKAYAVLDSVAVRHGRPVGRERRAQGFVDADATYQRVIDRMEATLGLRFRGPVAYAGITRRGRPVGGRLAMAVRAPAPLLGWRKAVNAGWFWRPLADHVRHNLTRPVDNAPVALTELAPARRAPGAAC